MSQSTVAVEFAQESLTSTGIESVVDGDTLRVYANARDIRPIQEEALTTASNNGWSIVYHAE